MIRGAAGLLLLVSTAVTGSNALLAQETPVPTPTAVPAGTQGAKVSVGPFSVPLSIKHEYLGRTGEKTVVRFTLQVARADLRKWGADQPRNYYFHLAGEVKGAGGAVVERFRVAVDADLSVETGRPLVASFLHPLPPGPLTVDLSLEATTGKRAGISTVALTVPRMESEFRAESAGLDAQGLPSAAAIVLEEDSADPLPEEGTLLRIVPPSRDVPVGLLRIDCEVKPPITKVEFWLDEKKVLARTRPPYTVEIDLGTVPQKRTLKALGFDRKGRLVDADAWTVNEKEARLGVRILELPAKSDGNAEIKVAVQSIAGGVARSVKLFLDDTLVKEWSAPPYVATLSKEAMKKATLLRASAFDEQGREASDMKLLKGESRFVAETSVDVVELNVTVADKEGRPARGLEKESFTVLEDGAPQEIGTFEYSESLPITLGLVIDGSGSMKEAMPLVHKAAGEFVQKLIGEKDKGFVIEFRERPTILAGLTSKRSELFRAVAETRADGGTALYDSVIMALYQFRSVPGRKAVVLLTDGQDSRSHVEYDTLRRYARSAKVPIYVIGLSISFIEVGLKGKLNQLADDTGGTVFLVKNAEGLPEVYQRIETDLRTSYFLTYTTQSRKPAGEFRSVEVRVSDPKLKVRTIRGYFP